MIGRKLAEAFNLSRFAFQFSIFQIVYCIDNKCDLFCSNEGGGGSGGDSGYEIDSPRPGTPALPKEEEPPRNLPWTPKVRQVRNSS